MEYRAPIQDFTDLLAWQKSHQLVLQTYALSRQFPSNEQFALTNQITRAVVSITSNIAEGFGRSTKKDKTHFYVIAKGSALEVRSQMRIAKDLGYIESRVFDKFEQDATEVTKLISGIIRSAPDH